MLLTDKTAIITGGADGIGWEIARTFASQGARIVIADKRADLAEASSKELISSGFEAVAFECDVTSEDDVSHVVKQVKKTFGSVDILVNNAGFTRDAVFRKMSIEDFRSVIDVHLFGTWLCTRTAVAAMRESGTQGSIINMSSISGKVGNPGQTNYSAAKAGIIGLTKAAAKEVGRYGIRVNALQPGLINTSMTKNMNQEALKRGLADVPLGRIGEPSEVANVAVFLASELSSYVTGTTIEITGGRHV